jgi:hypothetical protein
MRQYRCWFEFYCENDDDDTPAEGTYYVTSPGGISDFATGFWVNADMQFTKGSNCKYWIPPSKIYCVEILKEKQ